LNETCGRCPWFHHPWLSMVYSRQFAGAEVRLATRWVSTVSASFMSVRDSWDISCFPFLNGLPNNFGQQRKHQQEQCACIEKQCLDVRAHEFIVCLGTVVPSGHQCRVPATTVHNAFGRCNTSSEHPRMKPPDSLGWTWM